MPFRASWTQRALADELMETRTSRGLSIRDVAESIAPKWHNSKVSRIESARTKVSAADVRALGAVYEVDDETIARWVEMARDSITDAWWERYERWLTPTFIEFLAYENEAARAWSVQHMFMPGLLQTPDYIRALHTVGPIRDPGRNDAEYEVRIRRQRRLTEPDPLTFNALLAESALHWQFGSRAIMHAQLRHVREISELENVSVRVVPFARPVTIYPTDMFEPGSTGLIPGC
ncbi:helix-turn-helix domain-containing protein [Actinospica durhamensis]|uniref:Helix-turn-helix domain-containing protein n=1 Tax=Actinospica durhamensis TaxID=1508375 RepID=A0A941IT39_9ACTN|nr:helix-turn-helix transcriptional regulator [Actinospica durhamensis]MBR7839264.1 helix-turn-helix domain-containing protein [Actinospica durhamensis]